MARPKKPGVARHLHIDPYVRVAVDDSRKTIDGNARVDKALAWYDAQPEGERTKLCWNLIVAAVNGELGVAPSVSLVDEDAAQAQRALDDLLANMVLDEDEDD